MVEKMKFVNLTGPSCDVDRVSEEFLSRYSIRFEYAVKELTNEKELSPFPVENPYAPLIGKAEALLKSFGAEPADFLHNPKPPDMTKERAVDVINTVSDDMEAHAKEIREIAASRDECMKIAWIYEHFADIDFDVLDLARFEFLRYSFGKMPLAGFQQLEAFLYANPEILFVSGKNDGNSLWCVYFSTPFAYDKVKSIFSSLHFETIDLPFFSGGTALSGTPGMIVRQMKTEAAALDALINEKSGAMSGTYAGREGYNKDDIAEAYRKLLSLSRSCDAKKYAAQTAGMFFIYVGWMTESDAYKLKGELENDKSIILIIEDDNDSIVSQPPVKLRNFKFFRPFEFFVKMYGLPSYGEIDPTAFVAVTYTLLFGVMFADIGQGLVISLLGLYLHRKRKMALGSVMAIIGVSSMAFGVLFGSFFGLEIPPLLLHPAEPDNLTNTLIYAVGAGMLLVLTAISLNIANAVKQRRVRDILFTPNGLSGLVFYSAAAAIALVVLNGGAVPGYLAAIAAAPVVMMMLKVPLSNIANGKKPEIHGSPALFIFETVIEMFETMLGFFTNTVSFLRVGAFAISHASLMSIVWMLSATAGGSNNPFVLIAGNLLVMALEGLIVGIQVLRLQFYEMFSRFYEGAGRAFEPTDI